MLRNVLGACYVRFEHAMGIEQCCWAYGYRALLGRILDFLVFFGLVIRLSVIHRLQKKKKFQISLVISCKDIKNLLNLTSDFNMA
jgi:hypothetical protein